jgi:hypothetical protein
MLLQKDLKLYKVLVLKQYQKVILQPWLINVRFK